MKLDYSVKHVDISMPRCIDHTLQEYAEHPFNQPQNSLYPWKNKNYGVKQQMTEELDNSPPLSPAWKTRIQYIIGMLLYYGRIIDS